MKKFAIIATVLFAVLMVGCTKYESENKNTQEASEMKSGESECPIGDDEEPLPSLRGTAVDTTSLDSLEGVCVNLLDNSNNFVDVIGTDSYGHYYFNSVTNGSYKLVFSKSGYVTKAVPINIVTGTLTVNVQLLAAP